MLNQTIDLIYINETNLTKQRVRGLVEVLNETCFKLRDDEDDLLVFSTEDIFSITVVDEDEHHEFVNNMMAVRLENALRILHHACIKQMDEINTQQLTHVEYTDMFDDLLALSNHTYVSKVGSL